MNKLVAYFGCFWLFVVLDSFFIWNSYEGLISAFSYLGIIFITVLYARQGGLNVDSKSFFSIFFVCLFFLWKLFIYNGNINGYVRHFLSMASLLSIMTWPVGQYEKIYNLFRKAIIFFSIGSSTIFLLSVRGLLQYIPYFELPARSPLHESLGIVYHVYGCFVLNYGELEFLPRACGMLQEPGHFAIILGFVYLIDRIMRRKVSPWVVICGFLTFSPNFPIILVIAEMYNLFKIENFLRVIKVLAIIIVVGVVSYSFLSKESQEDIRYMFYERNFETVVDAYMSSGSLAEALDERTSSSGDDALKDINASNMLVGLGHDETLITLSDYRGVILQYGVIGLLLIVMAIIFVSYRFTIRQRVQVLAFLFLVLIQRSWMFYASYFYFLPYMCSLLFSEQSMNYDYDEDEYIGYDIV